MNHLVRSSSLSPLPLPPPLPRCDVSVRAATMADVPFLDALQKLHTKQVGWMPTAQFEGKIKLGHVLVAWASRPCSLEEKEDMGETPMPLGYCIGHDQYFTRDDVGIIYQMNVLPMKQRGFIGATLLKAMFERAAYGCRLFCCWCAQDIEANYFWESLGFVPLAFRSGSAAKARTHIFWQKRILCGDTTTPYWFPSQTSAGSIREDRIVLPIPPGTHWSDAKPIVLPKEDRGLAVGGRGSVKTNVKPRDPTPNLRPTTAAIESGGLRFVATTPPALDAVKPKREPKPKVKNDPRLVAAARELRDRWLEQVNATPVLPAGKYEVSRTPSAAEGSRQFDRNEIHPLPATPIPPKPIPPKQISLLLQRPAAA